MLSQVTGLPAYFVRKEAKTYGTCQLAEGGDIDGLRLVVVEDVVSSGGQVITSCNDLRERGAIVEHAVIVIDRRPSGPDALAENNDRRARPLHDGRAHRGGHRLTPACFGVSHVCCTHMRDAKTEEGASQSRQGGVRGRSKSHPFAVDGGERDLDPPVAPGERPRQVVATEEADGAGLERMARAAHRRASGSGTPASRAGTARSRAAGRRAPRSTTPARPRCPSPRRPLSPRSPTASTRDRRSRPDRATPRSRPAG